MRLSRFYDNIQRDLKLFTFVLFLLCFYRVLFMGLEHQYIASGTGWAVIGQANWTGLRLSLKGAGGVMLLSFVTTTLPELIVPRLQLRRLRLIWGTLVSFVLAVLFMARFPYYAEFGQTYGMQVMQGWHDDRTALFWTMMQEYGLPWRLALAIGLTAGCWYVLRALLLRRGTWPLPQLASRGRQAAFTALLVVGLAFFTVFVRFGGGFNYATGINWENAAVTGDNFLNECILDDIQALYRVRAIEKKMQGGMIAGVDKAHVRAYAAQLPGGQTAKGDDLTPYLARQAAGARIARPKHIFIVLGESWAQWPMLPQYDDLHVADGIKSLAAAGWSTPYFMPTGEFTSAAICGVVTGLVDAGARPNYQPRSYKEPYPTALAEQFRALGYQVDFWYGGAPDWDNLRRMALAQGFDHFYGYPDYGAPKTNTWGTNDKNLFQALVTHLSDEPPTVHLIMTTSNHPPYNIDLAAEGLDMAKMEQKVRELIPNARDPAALAKELGHYWYMDQVVTRFVHEVQQAYPDSLFVITGDHAVRTDPGPTPTLYEHQSIPCVIYGDGVTVATLPAGAVGSQPAIAATLIELIAPAGYVYHTLVPPMTEPDAPQGAAFNSSTWLTNSVIGSIEGNALEPLPQFTGEPDFDAERAKLTAVLSRQRTLSWWLLMQGTQLPLQQAGEQ